MKILIFFAVFVAAVTASTSKDFFYDAQDQWPGACVTGNRQSPINIVTADAKDDDDLTFIGWDEKTEGEFENTGTNEEFVPGAGSGTRETITPVGTYEVLQFHFHWGRRDGEGSEHRIDGVQSELEIHFVHKKKNLVDETAGDAFAVVAVLADSTTNPYKVSKIWEQLPVQAAEGQSVSVDIAYEDLLPSNRNYYFYEGSLTTPNCDEVVQWFVLQDHIFVPEEYLDDLRVVTGLHGRLLSYNFRDVQDRVDDSYDKSEL